MPESEKQLKVLLVEDDPLAAIGLRLLIGNIGYRIVAEARTGYEAVEQEDLHRPDLILMDIKMPGMDGIQATRIILSRRPVPVILVTAYHDQDTIEQGKQAGAVAYLIKPVSEYELKAAIQAAITDSKSDEFLL